MYENPRRISLYNMINMINKLKDRCSADDHIAWRNILSGVYLKGYLTEVDAQLHGSRDYLIFPEV